MTEIISTKQAAEAVGITGRELGALVKKYPQFSPERVDGFPPYYTAGLVEQIKAFKRALDAGVICPECGQKRLIVGSGGTKPEAE